MTKNKRDLKKNQVDWFCRNSDKLSLNSYYLAEKYVLIYQDYLEKIYNIKTKKKQKCLMSILRLFFHNLGIILKK